MKWESNILINKKNEEQIKKVIEDVVALVAEYNTEINMAIKNIGLDESYKQQIIDVLNKQGISFRDYSNWPQLYETCVITNEDGTTTMTRTELTDQERVEIIFEAELDAKRLKNAEISTAKEEGMKEGIKKGVEKGIKKGIKEGIKKGKEEGMKEGIKKGEIKSKIEDVINLVLATKMSIEDAIKILKVDSKYKKQIEKKLKRLGI